MAYQALYRKYRPRSFDDVVGQRHIIRTLKNAIEQNRIAHAYLFCGPRGTGKTSIAKIFARTLNCTGEKKPCMECENCRLSLSGSHPDIIEIDAASNNGVDEVRSLIDKVGYAPMEGKYKVYIIDEVHMMTSGAFNALLKTIEEPPAHVIFIFATTEPHKVLPTILSRCQRYDFSKVALPDIVSRLKTVCQQEEIQIDDDALDLIADLADGGMRDALSILDQCSAYEQQHISSGSVREIYGVVEPSQFSNLVDHLNPEEADQAVAFVEDLENKGNDMKRFTADLISLLKDSLLYDLAPNTPLIKENRRKVIADSFSKLPSQQRSLLVEDLMSIYNKFSYASNIMDYIETALLKSSLWENQISDRSSYENDLPVRHSLHRAPQQTAEQSQKQDIHHREKQNRDLAAMFWKSDVSRETFQNIQKSKSEIRYSEDFLLSLLTGASKEEKESDLNHMKRISDYANDLNYGRYAGPMSRVRLGASGPNYWLIFTRGQQQSALINEYAQEPKFMSFISDLIGEPKKVFAISDDEMNQLLTSFRTRRAKGTLPEPAQIDLKDADSSKEESTTQMLEKRIPDLVVIDD